MFESMYECYLWYQCKGLIMSKVYYDKFHAQGLKFKVQFFSKISELIFAKVPENVLYIPTIVIFYQRVVA